MEIWIKENMLQLSLYNLSSMDQLVTNTWQLFVFLNAKIKNESEDVFQVTDNHISNDHSVAPFMRFAHTANSAHSFHNAPLCSTTVHFALQRSACFICSFRSRARSLTLLTPSWDS